MSNSHLLGLGEIEPTGKQILFPSAKGKEFSRNATNSKRLIVQKDKNKKSLRKLSLSKVATAERIRTTVELSKTAFSIIQDIQHQYRLRTGKVLPLWKVISDAIINYGQEKGVS